jgi:hypothetical protein
LNYLYGSLRNIIPNEIEIEFLFKVIFSKEMIKTLAPLLLILVLQVDARNDPLSTLIAYEEKQRSGADLDSNDYSLIPFRLSNTPQTFLIAPNGDETISVEVVVHWISNTGVLQFPLFDLTQKVRMTIEE